jgi:hypothetical protein
MANLLKQAMMIGSFVAALGAIGAAPASAQNPIIEPLGHSPGPLGFVDPYAAYAYRPGLRIERSWEFSPGFDWRGASPPYRVLRVKPGGSVDPCFLSRRVSNRCY